LFALELDCVRCDGLVDEGEDVVVVRSILLARSASATLRLPTLAVRVLALKSSFICKLDLMSKNKN
jgi:hypothetical protein